NVANATVELRNQNTGIRQQTTTNRDGIYSLPSLQPGTYGATVQAPGFKTQTYPGIILNVAQRASLDFTLQIGAVSETVTVVGATPLMNTSDASVGTVVVRQFAANMPLNGRSFQALISLTPGIVTT